MKTVQIQTAFVAYLVAILIQKVVEQLSSRKQLLLTAKKYFCKVKVHMHI